MYLAANGWISHLDTAATPGAACHFAIEPGARHLGHSRLFLGVAAPVCRSPKSEKIERPSTKHNLSDGISPWEAVAWPATGAHDARARRWPIPRGRKNHSPARQLRSAGVFMVKTVWLTDGKAYMSLPI